MKKYYGFLKWFQYNTTFFFNTKLVYCIRLISGGSCDTEDWSNDAETLALPSQE